MENVLTIAGLSQVLLSVWVMDWMATAPRLALGAIVFVFLVASIRQVLKERASKPKPRAASAVRRASRVLYR